MVGWLGRGLRESWTTPREGVRSATRRVGSGAAARAPWAGPKARAHPPASGRDGGGSDRRAARPEAGGADLRRQARDRDAPALLGLGGRGADRVDAQTLVEHGEHAGRDDSEDGRGDEEVSEMHEGSVRPPRPPVNVPRGEQYAG